MHTTQVLSNKHFYGILYIGMITAKHTHKIQTHVEATFCYLVLPMSTAVRRRKAEDTDRRVYNNLPLTKTHAISGGLVRG